MTFIILKTIEDTDYYLSTSNIAGVTPVGAFDVTALAVQKGVELNQRFTYAKALQDVFLISARKDAPKGSAASDLTEEISKAEKSGKTLDLRSRMHKI